MPKWDQEMKSSFDINQKTEENNWLDCILNTIKMAFSLLVFFFWLKKQAIGSYSKKRGKNKFKRLRLQETAREKRYIT